MDEAEECQYDRQSGPNKRWGQQGETASRQDDVVSGAGREEQRAIAGEDERGVACETVAGLIGRTSQ